MFKNNRIKKLFMFFFISTYMFIFRTSVSASVINKRSSFGGFDSQKVKQSMTRSKSLGSLVETSTGGFKHPHKIIGTETRLIPFPELEDPGDVPGGYIPRIMFANRTPVIFFTGIDEEGRGLMVSQAYVEHRIYTTRRVINNQELRREYHKVIRDNNS